MSKVCIQDKFIELDSIDAILEVKLEEQPRKLYCEFIILIIGRELVISDSINVYKDEFSGRFRDFTDGNNYVITEEEYNKIKYELVARMQDLRLRLINLWSPPEIGIIRV